MSPSYLATMKDPTDLTSKDLFAKLTNAVSEGNTQTTSTLLNFEMFAQAARETRYDILQLFLDHDWDINTRSSLDSLAPSALIHAFHDEDLAKWFLDHGADPNRRCQMREATPLSYAVANASLEIIKLLFEYGGSIEHGQLLHYASMRGEHSDALEVLKYLYNRSPRFMDRVNCLLDEEYPEFVMNYRLGICTPLQYAAQAGSLQTVKFLVEEGGADPWLLDPYRRTALSYAVRHVHESVKHYLENLKR